MPARRCFLVFGMLASVATGCERRPDAPRSGTDTAPRVAALLHEAIAGQVREKEPGVTVLPADVSRREYASAVVPGLAYHFAGYPSPETTHRYYTAVAAARDSVVRVIRTGADWQAVLGPDWSPGTPASAAGACEELLVVTRTRRPEEVVFASGALDSLPALLPHEAAQVRRRVAPPRVSRVGENGWQVEFWVVQPRSPRGAVEYRCTLLPARAPVLAAIDSLVFPPAQ